MNNAVSIVLCIAGCIVITSNVLFVVILLKNFLSKNEKVIISKEELDVINKQLKSVVKLTDVNCKNIRYCIDLYNKVSIIDAEIMEVVKDKITKNKTREPVNINEYASLKFGDTIRINELLE